MSKSFSSFSKLQRRITSGYKTGSAAGPAASVVRDHTCPQRERPDRKRVLLSEQHNGNAVFYWLKKLRTSAIEASGMQFVELPAPAETACEVTDTAEVVIELNGAKIHVSNTGCRNTLAMVLEVISHAQ